MGTYAILQYDINSSNTSLVSVILPVFNAEKTLRDCLNSIVEQTLVEIEIICINDGSTDNSLQILEEYAKKDKRIKIISQENKGLSIARNIGIQEAKGEYIGFIDADDKIDLDFFEKLYNSVKEFGSDIACASIVRVKNNKWKYYLKINKVKLIQKTKDKYKYANMPHRSYVWNKIYKRKSLLQTGIIFEPNMLYEDIIFSHKVLHYLGKMVIVPGTNYYYQINDASITKNHTEKGKENIEYAQKYIQSFVQKNNICKGIGKHWYSKEIFDLTFLGVPILKIVEYGIYYQFCILNIPIAVLRKKEDSYAKS